jgi:hypothetical protein
MNPDAIDALEREVDGLIRKLDAAIAIKPRAALDKARHRKETHTIEHSDDADSWSGDGDASNPSLSATSNDEADDDEENGLDNDNGADEDEDDDTVAKASVNRFVARNDAAHRPGALSSSKHPANRHKFEAMVDRITADQDIPKSQAMAVARAQFPDVYRSYQRHITGSAVNKSAPTFEDLVSAEMATKGINAEVAGQRVAQAHGFPALHHRSMTKRAAVVDYAENELVRKANALWNDDPGLSTTEALRKSRLANPALYRALRSV